MQTATFSSIEPLGRSAPRFLFGLPDQSLKIAARYNPTALVHRVCSDPEANPIAVATVLDEATRRDWRDWEPEMLRDYLQLPGDEVQRQVDKVLATQVAAANPDVFEDWDLFHHVSVAFNHRRCNFEWLDRPSLMELAWSCTCLRAINGTQQFGPGVHRYLAAVLLEDGLTYFPWTGGEGMHLCYEPYKGMVKGIVEDELCRVGDEIKARWDRGEIQDLDPSEVDDKNTLHVQLSLVVACQAYIRAQKPSNPAEYGAAT